jgi:hypothetical protein
MSLFKDDNLREAYRLMHLRGITTDSLAAEVKTSRTFVSRVLCNYERHGGTWERIKAELIKLDCADVVALLDRVPVRQRSATHFRRAVRPSDSVFPAAVATTSDKSTSVDLGLTEAASDTPEMDAPSVSGKAAGPSECAAGKSISLSEVAARFCNWRQRRSA